MKKTALILLLSTIGCSSEDPGTRISEPDGQAFPVDAGAGGDAGDAHVYAACPAPPSGLAEVSGVGYPSCFQVGDSTNGATVCNVTLPSADVDCGKTSSTPVVAGCMAVIPMNGSEGACSGSSMATVDHRAHLHGFDMGTGKYYELVDGSSSASPGFRTEGTPQVVGDKLWWPHLAGGQGSRYPLSLLSTATWQPDPNFNLTATDAMHVKSIGTGMDSSGVLVGDRFYFGTFSTPAGRGSDCNNNQSYPDGVNPNCGALFAVDSSGTIRNRMDSNTNFADGKPPFRTWVAIGATTDGSSIYVGGSPSHYGPTSNIDGDVTGDGVGDVTGACSVMRMNLDLTAITAIDDPGEAGCMNESMEPHEDSLAGEIALGPNRDAWAQWASAVRRDPQTGLRNMVRHYDENLQTLCTAELPYSSRSGDVMDFSSAYYYGGPTVDTDGAAYVLFQRLNPGIQTVLYRIRQQAGSSTCAIEELYVANGQALHSPTLAETDDGQKLVLVAFDDELAVLDRAAGTKRLTVPLVSSKSGASAPTIVRGEVLVVAKTGEITRAKIVVGGSAVTGYGEATWPRYRRDNSGSARR